jgi:hypothetical protein
VIEVAVLYWARVQTAAGAPVAGRTVYFAAARYEGTYREDSTLNRRTATTYTDGRTYLDARFLLREGQKIILAASTTATHPLAAPGSSDVQQITFMQARAQDLLQGGNGLASFERTAEFTE